MIGARRAREDVWAPRRAQIIAGALGVMFVLIVGRAAFLSLGGEPEEDRRAAAEAQIERRADIVDRKGELLATSLRAWSLAADPRAIWDAADVAEALARALPGLDSADLARRLSDRDRHFVWIQRGLTPRQKQTVFELGLEGLRFEEELRRVYPRGKLAGHLLGLTDVDGKGVDGVELAFNDRLARGGEPLRLTIDAGVQFIVEDELEKSFADFDMKGGAGIVMDAKTGAVRAIASWPAMDPNRPGDYSQHARLNRAASAVYELGSIYKPLTVAAALESGVLRPEDRFDVSHSLKIGGWTVSDPHPLAHSNAVTPADIIAYSSNIGAVAIAQRLGAEAQRAFLSSLGLLSRLKLEGAYPAAPLTPSDWGPLTVATVSYGHGLAVSPIAFAAAFTPFANDGDYVTPRFVEPATADQAESRPVMSARTARMVLDMMRGTVTHGSGRNARAAGYEVAGKTGTAEKPGPDGYDPDRNVTSFAAVFPASRPQFVVLIVLDEAQPRTGDRRTAAYTAASIAGRVIARAAPILDVQPVMAPALVNEASPAGVQTVSEARPL